MSDKTSPKSFIPQKRPLQRTPQSSTNPSPGNKSATTSSLSVHAKPFYPRYAQPRPYTNQRYNPQQQYSFHAKYIAANSDPVTLSIQNLRSQLHALARELELGTVARSSSASEYMFPTRKGELFKVYLAALGLFLEEEGMVWYVEIPPPSSGASMPLSSVTSNSACQFFLYSSAIKRGLDQRNGNGRENRENQTEGRRTPPRNRQTVTSKPAYQFLLYSSAIERGLDQRNGNGRENRENQTEERRTPPRNRQLKRVNEQYSEIQFTPSSSNEATPDLGSLAEFPTLFSSRQSATIQPESKISISLDHQDALGSARQPLNYPSRLINTDPFMDPTIHSNASTSVGTSSSAIYAPQLLPSDISFVHCSLDNVLRICIPPEVETWIDIPGVRIHTNDRELPEGSVPIALPNYWDPPFLALARECMTIAPMREFEYKPTFYDEAYNPKPRPKLTPIHYPSGDDLGVDWSAPRVTNRYMKFSKMTWEEKQREARDVRWLWYLWRQHGLVRNWIKAEQPGNFGNKVRNKEDSDRLRIMLECRARGESSEIPVGFGDMKRCLMGERMVMFKTKWLARRDASGRPRWEV
ncbi:hypothetical protein SBOR_9370 [Sclerotinia borealis F-4128]|uniref:Uncharacterized protein n=1 Tax=Sclerotinia borealis (strain F-4128) TaxID=1432307 RepID=W9C5R4_SCLBF|nr:hypothetical protein SBOR_9370 [Sclerotinia borealis F-4128]